MARWHSLELVFSRQIQCAHDAASVRQRFLATSEQHLRHYKLLIVQFNRWRIAPVRTEGCEGHGMRGNPKYQAPENDLWPSTHIWWRKKYLSVVLGSKASDKVEHTGGHRQERQPITKVIKNQKELSIYVHKSEKNLESPWRSEGRHSGTVGQIPFSFESINLVHFVLRPGTLCNHWRGSPSYNTNGLNTEYLLILHKESC